MERHDEILEALKRIEANQRKALEAQEQHLALAKAQLERSERTVNESVALQKLAVARQATVTRIALPLIVVLIVLLGYLLVRWRIL
jgi:hypothetical protein